LIAVAGSLALLAAAPGVAQMGPRGGRDAGPFGEGFGGGPGLGLRTLQAADENGDKSIARAEFDGLASEVFAWRDRNSDGFLDDADASPVAQRLIAARAAERADEPDDARPERPGPGRVDADDDNRISRDEFMTAEGRLFTRLDADEDGVITPTELDEHADARRDRGRWWRER
jgi:hypothetical protein